MSWGLLVTKTVWNLRKGIQAEVEPDHINMWFPTEDKEALPGWEGGTASQGDTTPFYNELLNLRVEKKEIMSSQYHLLREVFAFLLKI